MRHHPSTALGRLTDAIHRAYVRMFGDRGTAPGSHHRNPGRPHMVLASTVVRAARAHRALLAECERMATLLEGARRGRSEAVFYRAQLSRTKAAMRTPARTRFAHAGMATRTAARETVAVAARAVRQAGAPAHRHIGAATRAGHDLAAHLLAMKNDYAKRGRAFGENSIWTTPRGLPA